MYSVTFSQVKGKINWVGFEEAMEKTIGWYKNNGEWWRKLKNKK